MRRMQTVKDKVEETDVDRIFLIMKLINTVSAAILILDAIHRIFVFNNYLTMYNFVMTGQLILFALIIVAVEWNLYGARIWFHLLTYAQGKSLFSLFLTLIFWTFGFQVTIMDLFCGIYFLLATIVFFLIFLGVRARQPEHIKVLCAQEPIKFGQKKENQEIEGGKAAASASGGFAGQLSEKIAQ